MASLLEALAAVGSVTLANAARRTALSIGGLLLCAALLMASATFFTLGAYRALDGAIGPIQAPFALGSAYLFFALVGLLVVQWRR
jgi:hypothetical protein